MTESNQEEQIDPRIVQLKLLSDIKKLSQSMIEEGIVEPLVAKTVTTTPIVINPPYRTKPWFGVKITNDGPQSVWVIVNTGKSPSTAQEIKVNETWGVQFKTAVIEDLYLYTTSGTAVVRIRGER